MTARVGIWTPTAMQIAKECCAASQTIAEARDLFVKRTGHDVSHTAFRLSFRDRSEGSAGQYLRGKVSTAVAGGQRIVSPDTIEAPVTARSGEQAYNAPPVASSAPGHNSAPQNHSGSIQAKGEAAQIHAPNRAGSIQAPNEVMGRPKSWGSWAIALPDMHVPFHSMAAVDLVCFVVDRTAKLYRGSLGDPELVLLGDYLDCLEVSKHRKDPELRMKFAHEVDRGVEMRVRLDCLAPWLAKTITLGNHENRLKNYVTDYAPALEGLIPSIGDLLAMPKNGWGVVDYGDRTIFGDLNITHDLDTAGKYAHDRSAASMGGSTLIGHTHRIAMSCTGTIVHGPQTAAMIGWLGDPEYARYIKRPLRAHWRHGFGILYRDKANHTHVVPVPIAGGRCVVGGTIYDLAELSGRKAA